MIRILRRVVGVKYIDRVIKEVIKRMDVELANNIKNLDIGTIAPTIENCHSINEKVSISSTKRVYNWLKETLIRYNKNN